MNLVICNDTVRHKHQSKERYRIQRILRQFLPKHAFFSLLNNHEFIKIMIAIMNLGTCNLFIE